MSFKQKNHQIPEEREKECPHTHMPYRARYGMPCTGPRICSMCDATEAELREEGER
ncbi:hypothetical protein LCGC14_0698550 [marine sediment metagenome]|uniref:Uncharacterized protein n=1 Tax=marine sediment metagenome TaxID=412755 RepID=A0A0F9T4G1_9ZZZZ